MIRAAVMPACGLAALGVLAAPGADPQRPQLLWNTTTSAPVGLYALRPARAPAVGDWLAIRPPAPLADWMDARGFLPAGALLLKQVAALAPSQVCRDGGEIRIDGAVRARALPRDHAGRPLPVWTGCLRLSARQMFVLNADPRSLDGRYFGPLTLDAIAARATPVWVTHGR